MDRFWRSTHLYAPSGTLVASGGSPDSAVLQFTTPEAGTYTAVVTDRLGDERLDYSIQLILVGGTQPNRPPSLTPATFAVREDAPQGAIVGTVQASDPDVGQTLSYSIASAAFSIDSQGRIRVADPNRLDFESQPQFQVNVTVRDDGSPRLQTTETFTINVVEVDGANSRPVVEPSSFEIDEDAANGTTVGFAVASDPDAGQTLRYSIRSAAFGIDAASGRIFVADSNRLDIEAKPTFNVRVIARDNGNPRRTGSNLVTITLREVPGANRRPQVQGATFSVLENASRGTIVGDVTASDPNPGQTLRYSIRSAAFAIDAASGRMTVADPSRLDFETKPVFTVRVIARDNGSPRRSGSALITINLVDRAGQGPVPTTALALDELFSAGPIDF